MKMLRTAKAELKESVAYKKKRVVEYIRIYITMVVIRWYLERDNNKILKFHMNDFFTLKWTYSSFKRRPSMSATTESFKIN